MYMQRFVGCCVARIITGFGQTATAETRFRPGEQQRGLFSSDLGLLSVEEIVTSLEEEFDKMKSSGEAIVTCVINDQQVNGVIALKQAGWTGSPWTKKRNHSETMVSIWYKLADPQTVEEDDPQWQL